MSLEKMEQEANEFIEQGNKNRAVKHCRDLSIAWAKEKNFKKATAWREKLIEIDSMAMIEILETGEVIESEKANAIDYRHQKVWENLYYSLSQEESIAFYLSLKEKEFEPGKVIIQQGGLNNKLFFVDSGQLKTVFNLGDKEVIINELTQGDTLGEDTFFNISNCTSTSVVQTPAIIKYIDRSGLEAVDKDHPGIAKILENYCSREGAKNTGDVLMNFSFDRRQYPRHKLVGKIVTQIYDSDKKPFGSAASGGLEYISVGGSAFSIKSSSKDIGRKLLGKLAAVAIHFNNGPKIKFNGRILSARYNDNGAYMTHLKFMKPFVEEQLNRITTMPSPSRAS
ncbi:MAG: Crp/Fnr family transcriptional regulator [Nitrospinales bacterium]